MLSLGSIVGGAFRLLRERPAAWLIWSLFYLVALIAVMYAMRPAMAMQASAVAGDPAATMGSFPGLGRILLAELLFFLVYIVLFTATQRAVLRPEAGGPASLAFGMDELRMIGLALFLLVLFYLGLIVVGVALTLVLAAAGIATGMAGIGAILGIELGAMFALAAWFGVRLSLVWPLTLLRGRIIVGESWRLTRGHFWTLFGAYAVLGLIALALWIGVLLVTAGPYVAEMVRGGFSAEAIQAAGQRQMARQLDGVDAMTVLGWLLSAAVGGLALALTGGAVATAAQQLTIDRDGMERTFG